MARIQTMGACCLVALVALFASVAGTAVPTAQAKDKDGDTTWEVLDEEDGITVYRREVPGRDVYAFRGDMVMNASIMEIIDVMQDVSKHTQWMYKCTESRILKRISEERAIGYTRVDAPWPLWDRDAVIDTKVKFNEDRSKVRMDFHGIDGRDLRKVPKKVIRMPRLDGFYEMHEFKPGKTRIRYQAISDIGGSVPKWMANLAAKDLPHTTLSRLRERVMAVHRKK